MAKNSAINLDVTPLADGFSIAGGTTEREARFDGSDMRFIGQQDTVLTLPNAASDNLIGESFYTAKGALLAGDGAASTGVLSVGTDGQYLRANSATATGLEWTAVSSGGWTWNEVTGTSATLSASEAVIANNAALVTLTLPAAASVGDEFWVVGKGAGLFRVQAAAGQTIHLGSSSSTVAGYLEATHRRDAVKLVCTVEDLEFTVSVAPQGNITVA
jgi:hypothetical protein